MKLITIDFWNTLFDSSNGEARNNYRISELRTQILKLNSGLSDDIYQNTMTESWKYFNNIWKNEQRTPSSEETIGFFWKSMELPDDGEAKSLVRKAFEESILYFPPELIDGAAESLEMLSRKYKLAVISDTGFSPGSVLRRLMYENDILRYFSAFSFSDETGVAKPNPLAYNHIFKETGCKAEESCHIGDIEDTDIIGAKNLGMHAIRFTGDPTATLNQHNPVISSADFQSDSWNEIVKYIMKTD